MGKTTRRRAAQTEAAKLERIVSCAYRSEKCRKHPPTPQGVWCDLYHRYSNEDQCLCCNENSFFALSKEQDEPDEVQDFEDDEYQNDEDATARNDFA